MKIRRMVAVMFTALLFCTACGQKEEAVTNSTNKDATADTSTEVSTDDSADETEEIQEQEKSVDEVDEVENGEIEYEEVIGDVDEIEYEEVVGDYDVNYGEITMADIIPTELGTSIPLMEAPDGASYQYYDMDAVELNGLTVLFPSPLYITGYYDNGVEVFDRDVMTNFAVSAHVSQQEYKESGKYTAYDYGKFIVQVKDDDDESVACSINIYNVDNGMKLSIQVTGYMESETGKTTISEYKTALVPNILAQVEAMSK